MGLLPLLVIGGGIAALAAAGSRKSKRRKKPAGRRQANPKCYLCGKRIGYTGKWYCKKCEAKAKKARG